MRRISKGLPTTLLVAFTLALGCNGTDPAAPDAGTGKTGTPKPSSSTKPKASGSPTATGSGSPGPNASGSPATGASGSPNPTGSGSPTTGASGSPGPNASGSPSATGSSSPKPTGSGTPTPTGSGTPIPTGSGSPSAKPSASATPTSGGSPTPAPSAQPTVGADGGTPFAGGEGAGFKDASGSAAQFTEPETLAFDAAGNLYVADTGNQAIRKISAAKAVTTVAGTGQTGALDNADGKQATFNGPRGLCVATDGTIFVADTTNHCIRKITAAGAVSLFAGKAGTSGHVNGNGAAARFNEPTGVAIDTDGTLFVADTANNIIRKITATGDVTDLCGNDTGNPIAVDGQGAAAVLRGPLNLLVDASHVVWWVEGTGGTVRKSLADGTVSTIASGFSQPRTICSDGGGNFLVADFFNRKVKRVTPAGVVTEVKGVPLVGMAVRDNKIYGIAQGENYVKTFTLP